jgi:hypothetical protein
MRQFYKFKVTSKEPKLVNYDHNKGPITSLEENQIIVNFLLCCFITLCKFICICFALLIRNYNRTRLKSM